MKKPDRTKIPNHRRVEAFERALLCCSVPDCYSVAPSLELHHISGRRSDPVDHELDNLTVLCRNHHILADRGEITVQDCKRFNELLKSPMVSWANTDPTVLLGQARSLLWAGEFDKVEAALRLLDKARYSRRLFLTQHQQALAHMHFADLQMLQNNPESAIKHTALAGKYFAGTNDTDGVVQTRGNTAAAYRMLDDFEVADWFFQLAFEAAEGIDDVVQQSERRRWILSNRGHVLVLAGKADEALQYLERSIEISIADPFALPDGRAESLVRFANTFLVRGATLDAEAHLAQAKALADESDRKWISGTVAKVYADLHLTAGRLDEAKLELSTAWSVNSSGFLFQQRELLRRVQRWPTACPDALEQHLRSEHAGCRDCRGQSVSLMAACSLAKSSAFMF
jgi:tetratricopeptide (TPR) repeat protein